MNGEILTQDISRLVIRLCVILLEIMNSKRNKIRYVLYLNNFNINKMFLFTLHRVSHWVFQFVCIHCTTTLQIILRKLIWSFNFNSILTLIQSCCSHLLSISWCEFLPCVSTFFTLKWSHERLENCQFTIVNKSSQCCRLDGTIMNLLFGLCTSRKC